MTDDETTEKLALAMGWEKSALCRSCRGFGRREYKYGESDCIACGGEGNDGKQDEPMWKRGRGDFLPTKEFKPCESWTSIGLVIEWMWQQGKHLWIEPDQDNIVTVQFTGRYPIMGFGCDDFVDLPRRIAEAAVAALEGEKE